jgi:hypothetical protein
MFGENNGCWDAINIMEVFWKIDMKSMLPLCYESLYRDTRVQTAVKISFHFNDIKIFFLRWGYSLSKPIFS